MRPLLEDEEDPLLPLEEEDEDEDRFTEEELLLRVLVFTFTGAEVRLTLLPDERTGVAGILIRELPPVFSERLMAEPELLPDNRVVVFPRVVRG